jgi:NADPH:quinone reductase-like Zn-dependent oxidoreductase
MRALGLTLAAFGEPARLTAVDHPDLAAGQLLIEIKAASINAYDWKVADGALRHAFEYDFPVTIGRDYAGAVTAVRASRSRSAAPAAPGGSRIRITARLPHRR